MSETNQELVAYQFTDTELTGFSAAIRGGGTDKVLLQFLGKGGPEWRATYPTGEDAAKANPREYTLDSLTFDATMPTTDTHPGGPVQIALRDRLIWAKVQTGAADDDGNIAVSVKAEISVYRHGAGLVTDPSGDPGHDSGILSPDLFTKIGRFTGLSGTLTIVRSPEAQQQDMFKAEDVDPCPPPEGAKVRTLRRGGKGAVQAFETAIEARDPEGNAYAVESVRRLYDENPNAILRTWDGGPVKVCQGSKVLFVLRLPEPASDAGQSEGSQDGTGDGSGSTDTEGD